MAPIPGGFGQGFPGLVYLSTFAYIDSASRPAALRDSEEQVFYSDLMVPHEVAHQWWGSVISTAHSEDEWLLEALANYSSLLWLEKKKGVKEMVTVLDGYRSELLEKDAQGKTYESAGPIVWGDRLNGQPVSRTWRTITYGKGTWIMHMLRRRMGDDAFFKLLAELRRRYEFKLVTTADFQALARELRPRGLSGGRDRCLFRQLGVCHRDSDAEAALHGQRSCACRETLRFHRSIRRRRRFLDGRTGGGAVRQGPSANDLGADHGRRQHFHRELAPGSRARGHSG